MTCKELAEAVRAACVAAAADAYEDSGVQGLCGEGRDEAVISALRRLDVDDLLRRLGAPDPGVGPDCDGSSLSGR